MVTLLLSRIINSPNINTISPPFFYPPPTLHILFFGPSGLTPSAPALRSSFWKASFMNHKWEKTKRTRGNGKILFPTRPQTLNVFSCVPLSSLFFFFLCFAVIRSEFNYHLLQKLNHVSSIGFPFWSTATSLLPSLPSFNGVITGFLLSLSFSYFLLCFRGHSFNISFGVIIWVLRLKNWFSEKEREGEEKSNIYI